MRHDNDAGTLTTEKKIKLRGHEIMMKLNAVGVPWEKCNLAALVVALELKDQYKRISTDPQHVLKQKLQHFELLEAGIKGYLPMSKEELLSRFKAEIEKAFEDAETISDFKTAVLDILFNPKTKFKTVV